MWNNSKPSWKAHKRMKDMKCPSNGHKTQEEYYLNSLQITQNTMEKSKLKQELCKNWAKTQKSSKEHYECNCDALVWESPDLEPYFLRSSASFLFDISGMIN